MSYSSYSSYSSRTSSCSNLGPSSFDRFNPRYSSSRRYGSGNSSSYSTGRYGGSTWVSSYSSRPRYQAGSHKPDYDSNWWKNRQYAEDETLQNKEKGKSVISVDFNKNENKKAHHTEKYGTRNLVIRRGQPFTLTVELKVKFEKTNDQLQFIFSKGEKPQESKGTLIRLNIWKDKDAAINNPSQGWQGYISTMNGSSDGSVIGVTINPPADALVGKYAVKTKVFDVDESKAGKRYVKEEPDEMLYVLFNAWCKDDQVYLEKESDRDEYVLNETGRIWMGTTKDNFGRPWNFGQFSKHSLDGALYLLDKNNSLKTQGHGNPTLVSRTLSAMANSCDNNGVLEGNWSGSFHGGTAPSAWNGSQAIIEQYMLTKRTVKYGQCWVFSGLITTLARALGIPTRSVTNFESAHDHDFSMTIDNHYSANGSPLVKMDDSVWNFHVWNESWFKRPDLPDGYDGWQAYDATPQEASEGVMRCGPAPVKAIKEGKVYLGYDTKFVFAEVNGDRVDWVVSPMGDMEASAMDPFSVGKCISSKQPGSNLQDDVTEHYKYAEGTKEEREAVSRASKYSSRHDNLGALYYEGKKDIAFTYNSDIRPNGDITVVINADNTTKEARDVVVRITATAAYYTGTPGEELCQQLMDINLDPSQKSDKTWSLKAASYLNLIDEDAKVKVYVMARVKGVKQVFTKSEVFSIQKPELQLQVPNTSKIGQRFDVTVTITNPLDVPLTEGVFRLEGPGIQKNMKIPIHQSIKPGEKNTQTVNLIPKYGGKREIIACFNSRQLSDITGAQEILVSE